MCVCVHAAGVVYVSESVSVFAFELSLSPSNLCVYKCVWRRDWVHLRISGKHVLECP